MRTRLKEVLKTLKPWERAHLAKVLDMIGWVENLKVKFGVSNEALMNRLDLTPSEFKAVCNGTYNYDLHFIAKLQAYEIDLLIEKKKAETGAVIVGNL